MLRRVRCIAIAFTCSVLVAASSQAAPTKALPRESAFVLESVASAWKWLVSLVGGEVPAGEPRLESQTAEDGYLIDPNGGPH